MIDNILTQLFEKYFKSNNNNKLLDLIFILNERYIPVDCCSILWPDNEIHTIYFKNKKFNCTHLHITGEKLRSRLYLSMNCFIQNNCEQPIYILYND